MRRRERDAEGLVGFVVHRKREVECSPPLNSGPFTRAHRRGCSCASQSRGGGAPCRATPGKVSETCQEYGNHRRLCQGTNLEAGVGAEHRRLEEDVDGIDNVEDAVCEAWGEIGVRDCWEGRLLCSLSFNSRNVAEGKVHANAEALVLLVRRDGELVEGGEPLGDGVLHKLVLGRKSMWL
jgi:hypothetical protein